MNAYGVWEFSDWTTLAGQLSKGYDYRKQRCTAYARFVVRRKLLPEFLEMYLPVLRSVRGAIRWRWTRRTTTSRR